MDWRKRTGLEWGGRGGVLFERASGNVRNCEDQTWVSIDFVISQMLCIFFAEVSMQIVSAFFLRSLKWSVLKCC